MNNQCGPVHIGPFLSYFACKLARSREFPIRLRLYSWIRRLGGGKRVIVQGAFGEHFAVDPDDVIQRSLLYNGSYEPEIAKFLLDVTGKGRNLLDIGANIGCASIAVALKGAEVDAFEADPISASVCKLNSCLSQLSPSIYRVHAFALGEKVDEVIFYRTPKSNVGQSGLHSQDIAIESFPVRQESIDSLVESGVILPAKVWKLDVEGAEISILIGADRTLKTHPPEFIVFEDAAATVVESHVANHLKSYGYRSSHIMRPSKKIELRENFIAIKEL